MRKDLSDGAHAKSSTDTLVPKQVYPKRLSWFRLVAKASAKPRLGADGSLHACYADDVLSYTTLGEGSRPVVLLHGFLGSGRNLGALARAWKRLDPELQIVLPDLLGHGRSPPLPSGGDLDLVARTVLELMETLVGPEPVPVVGHSLGGRVALKARSLAPDRISAVALLDIRPGPITGTDTERVVRILCEAPAETESRDAMRLFLEHHGLVRMLADWLLMNGDIEDHRFKWRIDRFELERFHRHMRGLDLWTAVEQAESPTVCIRGDLSDYVRPDDRARFERAGVPVHTVEGAGHFLHIDRTRAVVRLLHTALERP